jgi:hypothetical protein
MQGELLAADPGSRIRILAVNGSGAESGNAEAVAGGRTLPLLQDTESAGAWASWGPTYRDVVILDGDNRAVAAFNLTEHDLTRSPEYEVLLRILRKVAGE